MDGASAASRPCPADRLGDEPTIRGPRTSPVREGGTCDAVLVLGKPLLDLYALPFAMRMESRMRPRLSLGCVGSNLGGGWDLMLGCGADIISGMVCEE